MKDAILRRLAGNSWTGGALALALLLLATNFAGAQLTGFKIDNFGTGPMDIKTSGTQYTEFKNGALLKMILKDRVSVKMQDLNLSCDTLVYVTANSTTSTTRLEAQGNPVRIEQKGMTTICKRFEYFPDQKKAILSGDPVIKTVSEGKTSSFSGKTFTFVQDADGMVVMSVEGPTSGEFPQGLSGLTSKTEGQDKSAPKGGTVPGDKVNGKPATPEKKPSGTSPLEKEMDKPTDEKP